MPGMKRLLTAALCALAALPLAARTVRTGYFAGDILYEGVAEGRPCYVTEFLALLGRYTQCTFEYVEVDRDTAARALEDGTVDLLPFFGREADNAGSFSFSAVPTACGSLVLASDRQPLFDNLRVGLLDASPPEVRAAIDTYAAEQGFAYTTAVYPSMDALLADLAAGAIDAFCTIDLMLSEPLHSVAMLEMTYFYLAVKDPALFASLDTALSLLFALNPSFLANLQQKYIPLSRSSVVALTPVERRFVASAPEVRVAVATDQKPYCFYEKGRFTGLMVDLLESLAADSGLRLTFVAADSYAEALSLAARGETELVYAAGDFLPEADAAHIRLSNPILTQNYSCISRLGSVVKGDCVLVAVRGYPFLEQQIRSTYAPRAVQWAGSVDECIALVKKTPGAFAILPSFDAKWYDDSHLFPGVVIQETPFTSSLTLGVSEAADAELVTVLDRSIYRLTATVLGDFLAGRDRTNGSVSALIKRNPALFAGILAFFFLMVMAGVFTFIITQTKRRKDHEIMQAMNLANRDTMTGLYNHVAYEKLVGKTLEFQGEDELSAFIMLDVDNFKGVNDALGHAKGDYVIVSVANLLLETFRQGDIKCRMGGDEFSVFMKNVASADAVGKKLAQLQARVTEAFAAVQFPREITVSIGAACCAGPRTDGFAALYKAADEALYTVKKSGKNHYAVTEAPPVPPSGTQA